MSEPDAGLLVWQLSGVAGEDSIYFDQASGYWVASVSLGFAPDGKRRRRTVRGRTKTEVRDKLRDLREDIASNVRSPATCAGSGGSGLTEAYIPGSMLRMILDRATP